MSQTTKFAEKFVCEFNKRFATMRITWTNELAYKINFFLLILGPTLVFFFVKYNLWTSIFTITGSNTIQGYDLNAMLRYQALVMIVALSAQSYNSMNLSQDIRMGRISAYLIYPFQFWQFHTASFLAFQVIQLVITFLTLAVLFSCGILNGLEPSNIFLGLAYTSLVSLFWFAVSYAQGLVSFWLEESWAIRVIFNILAGFLSGSMFPLEIYPTWFVQLLKWTPFPYITYVPVKIMTGTYDGNMLFAAGNVLVWILIAYRLAMTLWRRGLRLHTAAGM